jgi:uncharacterized protein YifE (UPF0438 family)
MTDDTNEQTPSAAEDKHFEALVREYAQARESERQKAWSHYVHALFTSAPQRSVSKQSWRPGH